jgi:hypothetical protein
LGSAIERPGIAASRVRAPVATSTWSTASWPALPRSLEK